MTLMNLAAAFAIDPRTLQTEDPAKLLREIAENFESAPIRDAAKVPEPDLIREAAGRGVTPARVRRERSVASIRDAPSRRKDKDDR
jgi:hypothetical protein